MSVFTLAPFAPMLVQWVQSRIGRVQPFFLEETEDGEDEEREDEDETQELENEDD
jgi:hypothetical protein